MSDVTQPAAVSTDRIEQRFLESLAIRPFPVADLLEIVSALQSSGQTERRDNCVLLLEDAFAKEGEMAGLVSLLELRAEWAAGGKGSAPGAEFAEILATAAHKNRLQSAMVASIDFAKLPPREALRRLRALLAFRPGACCLDKTWGFGTIKRLDEFYRRVTIDFDRKKNHALAFAYAAESLKLLDDGHLLVEFHKDPAAFKVRMEKEPGEVVLLALRSFGPMSVTRMEDDFVAFGLLPSGGKDNGWKDFWARARNALKKNPAVKVPPASKKNEPIELLAKAVAFGDETWYEELSRNTDVADVLAKVAAVAARKGEAALAPEQAKVLANRVQFAYVAARTRTTVQSPAVETQGDVAVGNDSRFKHWQEGVRQGCADMARAALLAEALKLSDVPVADWIAEMAKPGFLYEACLKMASRDLTDLVKILAIPDDADRAAPFVGAMRSMPYALADVLLGPLLRGAKGAEAKAALADAFGRDALPFPLLLWVARHQDEEDVRALVPPTMLASTCMLALESQTAGEDLRLRHQIAKCYEDIGWVKALLDRMDANGRQTQFDRIRVNTTAWDAPVKRRILKEVREAYPDLVERKAVVEEVVEAVRLTSFHSYNAYRETYRRLVEEELPKNAHDIDVARGYGDLRENFEYQTAKDTQRMLLQRQATLAQEIAEVKATDFAGVPADKVAMGTEVEFRLADGSSETYSILGEWDSDEALHILPSRSRIAEALLGLEPGDTADLPPMHAGDSVRSVTVVAVRPLSDAVRAWIAG